ncbi:hypothetical protein [Usitatibacter palustris]|uniref:Uncharacterized protein n=1 Tax=Usitatibacter palustris TaxID=2732487 RepID=A0A6M4H2Z7_9PROT|nr:hypothetical protein [Usitatibacter palustris]QJR13448.1 hypothetical protein DSM104440_00231 [Usitatibacter palustris]
MKRIAILAAAALAVTAFAQDKKPAPPAPQDKGVMVGEAEKVTATVEAVDQTTRQVTLKGPSGNVVSFVAGPEVKNLAQVQKGDIVTIAFVQALALELKKTGAKVRERVETETKKGAPLGSKPAGIVAREVKVVASVEAVDAKSQKVVLRGPEHTVMLKVKNPEVLKDIKAGDFVEARYVEAVAIKVEKAPAAPAASPPPAPAAPEKPKK